LSPRTIGYYLALENGYFAEAGLDVKFETPVAGMLTRAKDPMSALGEGDADLAIEAMPIALRHREAGAKVVHVAQFFQKSSMELVCRAFIDKAAAIRGHAVGVWFGGYESSFFTWMSLLNLSIFGGAEGVTILRQDRDLSDFERFQVDCATSATYLAPLQFAEAGLNLTGMTIFRYQALGLGTLEDGLYANEGNSPIPTK
jgi:NitT/TauT family transport system substrate-binding protein